jgi:hypothetical protein
VSLQKVEIYFLKHNPLPSSSPGSLIVHSTISVFIFFRALHPVEFHSILCTRSGYARFE